LKEAVMKRLGLWTAGAVLLVGTGVLAGGSAPADARNGDRTTCSVATLRGTYLFAIEGIVVNASQHLPFAGAGYEVYDGRGNVLVHVSLSQNGQITRNVEIPGTYTVDGDCTATSTLPGTEEHFDMFVAPDGSMFTFVSTDPGVVFSGSELRTAKRVSG
jgi:hypothetical protein